MTGHVKATSMVMRRPDGTPMTRQEVLVERRGAFKWLPVLCSNDLVHGSWWFVWGSFGMTICAVVPLIQQYLTFYHQSDDFLPRIDFEVTWALLIFSGVFFTLGSLAFVRAFEEPPKVPLFKDYKHFQTDELFAAWLFTLGTIPAVPYCFVFFTISPSFTYMAALILSCFMVAGCALFVIACYPSDKKAENYLLPLCLRVVGPQMWMMKHLANDWLAGTWFFLWANGILTFASFVLMIAVFALNGGQEQVFVWVSGFINSLLFLIGSLYFVSGSYPHAQQFYYAVSRGHVNTFEEDKVKQEDAIRRASLQPHHGLIDYLLADPELAQQHQQNLQHGDQQAQSGDQQGRTSDVYNPINPESASMATQQAATTTTNPYIVPSLSSSSSTQQLTAGKPAKSQTMNLRLQTATSPLHEENIMSSAGVAHHGKTKASTTAANNNNNNNSSSTNEPSPKQGNSGSGYVPVFMVDDDENHDDDDEEVDEVEDNNAVASPFHGQSSSNRQARRPSGKKVSRSSTILHTKK